MAFDLKAATPDTTFPAGGFVFGADSQSATDPSIYTGETVVSQSVADMAQTWNNGATTFTAIKMSVTDTTSASASLLMDLRVGGQTQFSISKNGDLTIGNSAFAPTHINMRSGSGIPRLAVNGAAVMAFAADPTNCPVVTRLGITSAIGSTHSILLERDANDTLALRRSTNPNALRIYNTYTDASNHERLDISWSANVLRIRPEAAGTGTVRVIHISGLPTANPGAGILWNDAGTVKVGT